MQPKLKLIVNQFLQLVDAVDRDDLIRFRRLLADGADANATGENGKSVLHCAATWDNQPVASILIDHGANIHASDSGGFTPLHLAASYSGEGVIGLLLDRGANIDARDNDGWTPLHMAARVGRIDEVAFLVSRGADVLIRENKGRTPLDVALENDFLQDQWPALERLLGGGHVSAGDRQSLPSPSEIVRDSRSSPSAERDGGNDWGPHDHGR
jgi:ankyrin repeat protein